MKHAIALLLSLSLLSACEVTPIEKRPAEKAAPLNVVAVPSKKKSTAPSSRLLQIDQVQQSRVSSADPNEELSTAIEKGIIKTPSENPRAIKTFSQDLPLSDVDAATPVAVILTAPNNKARSLTDSESNSSPGGNFENNIFQNRPSELQKQQNIAAEAAAAATMDTATQTMAPGITITPGN